MIKSFCLIGVVLQIAGCCVIVPMATAERQPLSYVGEVSIGTPTISDKGVVIPLTFTGGEWERNSGISLYRIKSVVSGQEIDISITTSVVGDRTPQLLLHRIGTGNFTVFYRDPDGARRRIGEVAIVSTKVP
jgi:hypothetical protein